MLSEEFRNEVSSTVESILKTLPGVKILIVSKKIPYPPLDLPEANVEVGEYSNYNPMQQLIVIMTF